MFRNKAVNILLIVVLSLGLLGTVLFVAYKTVLGSSSSKEASAPKAMSSKELAAAQFDLGKITTNLSGDSLIQVSISIQGDDANVKKEIEERKAQVKDIINSILHTTAVADIQKADGYPKLKQRIVSELNKVMQEGKVTDAYLSDIVVQ
ncbi:MAG: flagellar basal body-associated FliL family protein [Tumebacillaceae bacterium]